MIITKKHNVLSKKIRKNITIVQISDLDYNDYTDQVRLTKIVQKIKILNPSYVIFCGDILFSRSNDYTNLIKFFSMLGSLSPVYITYGNKDVMALANDSKGITNIKWVEYVETELFDLIKTIPGINILENETKYLDEYNVSLTGINMDYRYYEVLKEKPRDFVFRVNDLFPEFQSKETFNEISCHSPKVILNKKFFDAIYINRNADLIHSGHMHNGAVPLGIGIFLPKNKGLMDPHENIFPDLARGSIQINNTLGIIGGPLTTIAESQGKKSKLLNTVMPSRMDVVYVKR